MLAEKKSWQQNGEPNYITIKNNKNKTYMTKNRLKGSQMVFWLLLFGSGHIF